MRSDQREAPKLEERDLLERAVRALAESTGFGFTIELGPSAGDHPDGYIRVPGTGAEDELWPVEVKRHVSNTTLGPIAHRMARSGAVVLVTEYVNPQMADRLRDLDLAFIDTAGNAYLKFHPFYIFAKGVKPERKLEKTQRPRLFQTSGLKIIFGLLNKPELANETYRDIAGAARVALGTVSLVINDLHRFGFLQSLGENRRLVRRQELLSRWVTAYAEQLRPKLMIGRFETDNVPEWPSTDLHEAYWGGEVAAAKLTGYLHPETITIYLREKRQAANLQLRLKLRKTNNPNVELLTTFWDPQFDASQPDMAPVLVTYADLLASAEPRNLETAKVLYEQQLDRLVRED